MNRIYRSVWNEALGTWVAAPENARTCKKSGRSPRLALLAPAALALGLGVSSIPANAAASCASPTACGQDEVLDVSTAGFFDSKNYDFNYNSILNLDVASGATALSGFLNFRDSSVLNANVTNAISGTHSSGLSLHNNAILNAKAANSVSGKINVNQNASIILQATDALSSNANLYFKKVDNSDTGGTLDLNGFNTLVGGISSTSTEAGVITNNGATAAVLTINGGVGDFDGLIEDGTAKLGIKAGGGATLFGIGTYTGGTEIFSGSLFARHNSLGTGDISITDYNGRLEMNSIDTSGTDVLNNNVSGVGALYKRGAGTLRLAGTNTHQGGTYVEEGTLAAPLAALGDSGSVISVDPTATLIIKNNATGLNDLDYQFPVTTFPSKTGGKIIFDVDADKTITSYGATLHSNTAIEKTGLGDLYLGNDYSSQAFIVNQGSLSLAPATIVHDVTINSGGRLAGSGNASYVRVNAGGALSPSNGNTMNLANLYFDPAGTYIVTALDSDTPNSSSHVNVSGTAILNDASVQVNALNGSWQSARTYTILSANTLSGEFSGATANFAYLSPTLAYNGNQVELTLTRTTTGGNNPGNGGNTPGNGGNTPNPGGNTPGKGDNTTNPGGSNPGNSGTPMTFASLAETANQRGVANSVESLPSNHEVYGFVETLPVGAPASVFNNLSGEAHASVLSGLPDVSRHAATLPMTNMRNTLNAGLNPVAMTAQVGGTLGSSGLPATTDKPAWVQLVGNWQDVDGDRNTADLDQHSGGVFVGYDNEIANGWYLGGSLGYTDTDSNVSDRRSDAEISSYSATVYGGKAFALDTQRQLNVMAGLSYTLHDVETERSITGLEQKLKADYDVSTTQLFGEIGYVIGQPDKQYIEPFAGLTVTYLDADGFTERGGSAALKGKGETDTQTVSTLGVRAQTGYTLGNNPALLRGSLAWQHAFEDERMDRTLAFRDGSDAFAVKGVALARDTAVVGLGTQVDVSPTAAVSLDYEGKFASGLTDHGASVKVHWSF
ncbi:autotransporter domain-containing protein [Pseudomonas sp. TTU2014-080ASC]|uniref:autotransporter domain-containing protein n=1 Tax=Pseudomonas sp. TTU2014-080ASC TaxID=1729724 RepID=UPI0007187E0C|nr:autotransporter domain-containing protein [Pseudomonas sp. TTU2014-080ASC]KRW61052.1 hypothetical protein AO726_06855 [Pseudomonas sp. TTU2014-080ASC]